MRKIVIALVVVTFAGMGAGISKSSAADQPSPQAGSSGSPAPAAPGEGAGAACCKAGDATPPLDLIKNTTKGQLHSPYNDKIAEMADEGHKKYMAAGCNGCHGGGGGGGMGPPLTNEIWVYGKDDDTLFRLVALGSDGLQKEGYRRKGSENVVGPMPSMGTVIKSGDDMWKIIAWIRSVNPSSLQAPVPTPPQ